MSPGSNRFLRALVAALIVMAQAAQAATYPLPAPGDSVIGDVGYELAAEDDTLVDIARRQRLGYDEIVLANPAVDRWLPGEGTSVLLPTRYILPSGSREGIVVNLAEFRLYYYVPATKRRPAMVETYAVSAGRNEWKTPNAVTTIARRLENPAWYPPKTIRDEHAAAGRPLPAVVPPGPDNPLGPLALKLAIPGGYFIHGTSKPFGIGMRVTHGCLRLYVEDMATLFKIAPEGTKVRVVDEPYKAGWKDRVLYVEAHPPRRDDGPPVADLPRMAERIRKALAKRPGYEIDWAWLEAVALQPRGVPMPVLRAGTTQG